MKSRLPQLFIFFFTALVFVACLEDDAKKSEEQDYPETQAWWTEEIFYQVFVRSFYDSDGDGIGDLKGVIQKLDYLNDGNAQTTTDLGVTALVLMPVFSSSTYDGYATVNHLEIDPDYGTLQDLKELIAVAEQRGMRIILDFPINHTSNQHSWFSKAASADPGSFKDWYIWKKENPGSYSPYGGPLWHAAANEFYYALFGPLKPDLNFTNEAVTTEIKNISEYWIKEIGVHGFRMEGAGALIESGPNIMFTQENLDWWRDYFSFVRKLDPAFMLIGDVPGLSSIADPYADDRLDLCYEYELSSAIFSGIKNQAASTVREKMIDVINRYPSFQWGIFLTNQFQNRTIEILNDTEQAKLAASILLTLPGVPFLYYGEEIAMSGSGSGEEIRRPMQWSGSVQAGFTSGSPWYPLNSDYPKVNVAVQENDSRSVLNHYKQVIQIRKNSLALKRGSFEPVRSTDPRVFSFMRIVNSEIMLVIHNLSGSTISNPTLSNSDGSLSAATYSGKFLPSEDVAPSLVITGGGSFTEYAPIAELLPHSTLFIRFSKSEQ